MRAFALVVLCAAAVGCGGTSSSPPATPAGPNPNKPIDIKLDPSGGGLPTPTGAK